MAKSVNARDARMLAEARAAIDRLIDRGERGATGMELLGEAFVAGRWGRDLMRRLTRAGLVSATEPHSGIAGRRPFLFRALEPLHAFGGDDAKIATLVWPGHARLSELSRVHRDDLADDDDAEEVPPSAPAPDEHSAESEGDLEAAIADVPEDALLQSVVKLCAATLQNVVYMRQRVDALTKEVAELKKVWE